MTGECLLYVLGLVEGECDPEGLAAIEDGSPAAVHRMDGFGVVLYEVPASIYRPGELKARLADLEWLEARARRHSLALEQLLAQTAVIPVRFLTVFERLETLEAAFHEHQDAIAGTFRRVGGKEEWAVRISGDQAGHIAREVQRKLNGAAGSAAQGAGAAFLLRKRREAALIAETEDALDALLEGVHRELSALAAEAAVLPVQPDSSVLLSAAYLVAVPGREAFLNRAGEIGATLPDGFRLDLSGPWPPYNFVFQLTSTQE